MANALANKQQKVLLVSLEHQGCKVRRTKDGWFVAFPSGGGTSVHTSTSDHRAVQNLRSTIRRAGLEWPFD
jgi:hypothetical protein